jgi:dipeptidase
MGTLSIYVPFYQGAKIPLEYQVGDNHADDFSACWKFRKWQMLGMLNKQIHQSQQIFEKEYLSLYKANPKKTQELLDTFTAATVVISITRHN